MPGVFRLSLDLLLAAAEARSSSASRPWPCSR